MHLSWTTIRLQRTQHDEYWPCKSGDRSSDHDRESCEDGTTNTVERVGVVGDGRTGPEIPRVACAWVGSLAAALASCIERSG